MATVRARAPSDRAVERSLPTALVEHAAIVLTVTATTAPTLIAYNLPPSPTQLNQLAALALWGCAAVALAMAAKGRASYANGVLSGANVPAALNARALRSTAILLGALLLVASACIASGSLGSLSPGLAWSGAAIIAATAVVVVLGAFFCHRCSRQADCTKSQMTTATAPRTSPDN